MRAAPRAASASPSELRCGIFTADSLQTFRFQRTAVIHMQRLKTRAQFQAVLAGATVARTPHFALHRCVLGARLDTPSLFDSNDVWIGAMVPKRWAKRAVTRNAIKRQIYNVSTALQASMPEAAHVVRLRSSFDRKIFVSASSERLKSEVRSEVQQLLARAGRTANAS